MQLPSHKYKYLAEAPEMQFPPSEASFLAPVHDVLGQAETAAANLAIPQSHLLHRK